MFLGGRSSPLLWLFLSLRSTHSAAVEFDNAIWFRIWSGLFSGCQGLVEQLLIVPPFWPSFPSKHVKALSVSM